MQDRASQMGCDATGRITYNGPSGAILPITANIVLEPASGTNKNLSLFFYKNGVQETNSEVQLIADTADSQSVTIIWQDEFMTSDYYEVFVENRSDTTDIDVNSVIFRVN